MSVTGGCVFCVYETKQYGSKESSHGKRVKPVHYFS